MKSRALWGLHSRCQCLTPHGVSGLKSGLQQFIWHFDPRLTPHGVSGLKSDSCAPGRCSRQSHPAWGEWIEIPLFRHCPGDPGLTPHGVSGLKFASAAHPRAYRLSHPAWGEWIEIICNGCPIGDRESHPAWGEWIEIPRCRHSPPCR